MWIGDFCDVLYCVIKRCCGGFFENERKKFKMIKKVL